MLNEDVGTCHAGNIIRTAFRQHQTHKGISAQLSAHLIWQLCAANPSLYVPTSRKRRDGASTHLLARSTCSTSSKHDKNMTSTTPASMFFQALRISVGRPLAFFLIKLCY